MLREITESRAYSEREHGFGEGERRAYLFAALRNALLLERTTASRHDRLPRSDPVSRGGRCGHETHLDGEGIRALARRLVAAFDPGERAFLGARVSSPEAEKGVLRRTLGISARTVTRRKESVYPALRAAAAREGLCRQELLGLLEVLRAKLADNPPPASSGPSVSLPVPVGAPPDPGPAAT